MQHVTIVSKRHNCQLTVPYLVEHSFTRLKVAFWLYTPTYPAQNLFYITPTSQWFWKLSVTRSEKGPFCGHSMSCSHSKVLPPLNSLKLVFKYFLPFASKYKYNSRKGITHINPHFYSAGLFGFLGNLIAGALLSKHFHCSIGGRGNYKMVLTDIIIWKIFYRRKAKFKQHKYGIIRVHSTLTNSG